MNKYFYTDALAAAWMIKHFGMKIQYKEMIRCDGKAGDSGHLVAEGEFVNETMWPVSSLNKAYVHPSSISMLVPRIGDVFIDSQGAVFTVDEKFPWIENGRSPAGKVHKYPIFCIYRDGKAFITPEDEQ